jgi:hypothetical protein
MATIATLIPAYRPTYLRELLEALAAQRFTDFTVLLSDDSPDGSVTRLLASAGFRPLVERLGVQVLQGPRLGAMKNVQFLLQQAPADSPLLHVLLDDDLVYPDFYRAHVQAHECTGTLASTSLRWMTGPDGRPSAVLPLPGVVSDSEGRMVAVDQAQMYATTVVPCRNWVGELSHMVLAREAYACLQTQRLGELSYYGLGDIGVVLEAVRQKPVVVIRDHLGAFRTHPAQGSAAGTSFQLVCGHVAWLALALGAWQEGLVTHEDALRSMRVSLQRCAARFAKDPELAPLFRIIDQHALDLPVLHARFGEWWHQMLASHPDSSDRPALPSEPILPADAPAATTAPGTIAAPCSAGMVRFGVLDAGSNRAVAMP